MKSYLTVKDEYVFEQVIEKSRFIGVVRNVKTAEEAETFMKSLTARYPQATHYCYGYVLTESGAEQKMSDNGEPQGTAGVPILEVIKKRKLTDTIAAVVRYFGGVKLGAGGLVRAYSDTAAKALDGAEIATYAEAVFAEIDFSYNVYPAFERAKLCEVESVNFSDGVTVRVVVPESEYGSFAAKTSDLSGGKAVIRINKKGYFCFRQ